MYFKLLSCYTYQVHVLWHYESSFTSRESTGYTLVRQFRLPAETVRHIWLLATVSTLLLPAQTAQHIWLPPRESQSCFLPRLLYMINGFLPSPRDSASCRDFRQEAQSRGQSGRKPFFINDSKLGIKQEVADTLGEGHI